MEKERLQREHYSIHNFLKSHANDVLYLQAPFMFWNKKYSIIFIIAINFLYFLIASIKIPFIAMLIICYIIMINFPSFPTNLLRKFSSISQKLYKEPKPENSNSIEKISAFLTISHFLIQKFKTFIVNSIRSSFVDISISILFLSLSFYFMRALGDFFLGLIFINLIIFTPEIIHKRFLFSFFKYPTDIEDFLISSLSS